MSPAPAAIGCAGTALLGLVMVPIALIVLVAGAHASPSAALAGVPADYRDAVAAAAADCPGLPAEILAAQLQRESGFDPAAVSPAGAQGIAQFMPGTWSVWGRDADGDGEADPLDPADAIDAQGRFMCHLLGAAVGEGAGWGDPIDLALAGYNAGWGAVRAYRGVPPYRETRDYVAAIRAAAAAPPLPESGSAVWPVDSPDPVTNGFGNRPDGIRYALGWHTGVDFNADRRAGNDYGQPVRAARAGTVAAVNAGGPLGNEVVVAHGDGMFSSYGHLAGFAPGIHQGARVDAGQRIGTIGCSGMSRCAPHLHFEVRRTPGWQPGAFIDPMVWLGLG